MSATPRPTPVSGMSFGDGALLSPGAAFGITCKTLAADTAVVAVKVSLESSGESIASALYARRSAELPPGLSESSPNASEVFSVLDSSLPVSLPGDIDAGQYDIRIAFFSKDGQVFEKSVQVFILDSAPAIRSIQVCPAPVSPATKALLRAEIDSPEEGDPYLVWKFGQDVLGSGRLADGLDQVLWKAPDASGVYAVTLFVYPFPPPSGREFPFDSTISRPATVVVEPVAPDPADPFREKEAFYSLFDFSGDFEDSGYRRASGQAVQVGKARASVLGSSFGYAFDDGHELDFDEYLLPLTEGKLDAFSLMGRFLVPKRSTGHLFRSESVGPGFSLELGLDDSGQLALSLSNREKTVRSVSGIRPDGRLHDVAVSLIPRASDYFIQWYIDGKAGFRESLDIVLGSMPAAGRAYLGGDGSVQTVYDEFGVYSLRSEGSPAQAWSKAYALRMAKTYRGDLLMAEGFESPVNPAGLSLSGELSWDSGSLKMGSGSALGLSLPAKAENAFLAEIQLRDPPESSYSFQLSTADGKRTARVLSDGSVIVQDEKVGSAAPLSKSAPSITLDFVSGVCYLVAPSARIGLIDSKGGSLELRFGPDEGGLKIESLLLRRVSDMEMMASQSRGAPRSGTALSAEKSRPVYLAISSN